jgi:hypothetical protein
LSSRGKIVRNGIKRVDAVAVENDDEDQQKLKASCNDTSKMNEEDDT